MRLPAPGRGPHQAAGLTHLGEPQGLRAQVPGGIPGLPFFTSPHDRLLRTRRGSRQAVTLASVIQKTFIEHILYARYQGGFYKDELEVVSIPEESQVRWSGCQPEKNERQEMVKIIHIYHERGHSSLFFLLFFTVVLKDEVQ